MLKIFFTFTLCFIFLQNTNAKETGINQSTSAPSSSQFEIIQSTIPINITIKIDKYTGKTYQLVKVAGGLN